MNIRQLLSKPFKKQFVSIFSTLVLILVGMSFAASSAQASGTTLYAYLSFGGVSVVNTDTQMSEAYIPASNALLMDVTPDGAFLYIIENGNSTVTVYDTATNTLVDSIVMGVWPDPQIIDIQITPNGQFAYVSERWTGEVAIIDISSNTVVGSVDTGNYAFGLDITPNGDYAYVTNEYDHTVSVISTATNTVVNTISSPHLNSPTEVAITPDGAYAYVVNFNGGVAVIDTSSNTVVANVTAGTSPHGVDVTPDGNYVYVSNYFSNDVTVIETATNSVVTTIPTTSGGTWLREVEITPDGQFAYVAVQTTNKTEVIDIATNTIVDTLPGGYGIAFANVSTGIADADGDGIADGDDNCPSTANAGQEDLDSDGLGDVCDADRDGDGVDNNSDAFPDDATESVDTDGDGIGNNADTDDDGDGQSDTDEQACGSDSLNAASISPDNDGDSSPDCVDADDDNDGVADVDDKYPFDPTRSENSAPEIEVISLPAAPVDINNQPISGVSATFTDVDEIDTHTCTVDFGDGSGAVAGTVSGMTCLAPDHTYTSAGVYEVTFTVADNDGGSDSESSTSFIVIYDPNGGFVTGGGWINSPAGAYVADATATGKANFGFVSKYKKGANVPTGQTEFQFKAGNLNFHSSSYEWLVIAGKDKAKYKGEGTINGSGNYGFMITAVDNGNSGDTFRIKIWDKDSGNGVVYDNQMGSGEDAYDGTTIGGGNIKVHSK